MNTEDFAVEDGHEFQTKYLVDSRAAEGAGEYEGTTQRVERRRGPRYRESYGTNGMDLRCFNALQRLGFGFGPKLIA